MLISEVVPKESNAEAYVRCAAAVWPSTGSSTSASGFLPASLTPAACIPSTRCVRMAVFDYGLQFSSLACITKAIVEGIIDSETKSLEIRLQEFRDSLEFNEVFLLRCYTLEPVLETLRSAILACPVLPIWVVHCGILCTCCALGTMMLCSTNAPNML